MSDYSQSIALQIKVSPRQVSATIELLDGGNTLPFIARYRKEATGGLDEEQIRQIGETLENLRALDERRATILSTVEEQGKLTPELRQAILEAKTRTDLEDLYLPYKPKRRTRASIAREKGLQGLADMILKQAVTNQDLGLLASPFISDQVLSIDDAFAGARDIVAEEISDNPDVRRITRDRAMRFGVVRSEKIADAEDPRLVYELYYNFEYRVETLRPHQVLAIQRGEDEKVLKIALDIAERDWQAAINTRFQVDQRSNLAGQLEMAIQDGAERLLLPAIERDVRRTLFEKAEAHAIGVFAANLRGLLSQPPLAGYVVMGIDPGFRTGCKVAVIDPTGRILDTVTIYPHEPRNDRTGALKVLGHLVEQHGVTLISTGNGTASRETEQLVVDLIKNYPKLRYLITNEAGASVYSASPLARAELPDLDVSMRGAVSIARRVQDPLAELVKIDPKSIGVGMYQHDVDQKQLAQALNGVVESVVNRVGVDVNTASPALLTYVAGIGPKLADSIVAYRDENGPFCSRVRLKKVPGLGPKAFEQSAGFLRIRDGSQPFDASAIHPESYAIAEAVLKKAGIDTSSKVPQRKRGLENLLKKTDVKSLAEEVGAGVPTVTDILEQLIRPGRDPREDLPAPILRSDVISMEDLTPGMHLKGTVRNVVDFGAFVDIGVKQDGLLHRSQIPQGTQLRVGEVISVSVLKVEPDRKRISLAWSAAD